MSRIMVNTVEEAVQAAEALRDSGRTYWFRGESKVRPLRSSLSRVKQEDRQIVLEKLARYEKWIKRTPGLEDLAGNTDAAIAVAQHYDLLTNFVDFTTKPQIAGFFASEKAGPDGSADTACIICLDVEDLKQFWKDFPTSGPAPEFLEMTVPDLWRLEAQHGCFLYCPYDNIEKRYPFDRILFPNTHVLQEIKREDVYPERKSNLEILLDQYFMNERMLYGDQGMRSIAIAATPIVFETPPDRVEPDVFRDGLLEHPSWADSTLRPWLKLPAERFDNVKTTLIFPVRVPDTRDSTNLVTVVSEQLLSDLLTIEGVRNKLIGWEVQWMGDSDLPKDFPSQLAPRLAHLWDGLRRLPYSNEDICAGFGMCVAFTVAIGGDLGWHADSMDWERAAQRCLIEPVELEFGAEDGSYSRGFASSAGLAAAVRPELVSHISDQWKKQIAGNVRGILQSSSNPRKTFDFRILAPLFAREIAPFQVLARSTAIFYSPARLVSLGLP